MKSCHYGSSCGHKQGKSVLSYPPGKHANLKTDFTAQLCGKTRLDATHFVQPPSCPKPTSTPTFPHHNNEKSKKMPHFLSFNPVLSFNPQVSQQHKLEGAGPEADPFESPINTVQVFRCAPFLGSPLVGVALGLMTINVRTPPVGTIERSWQFPENFSPLRSGSRLRTHNR